MHDKQCTAAKRRRHQQPLNGAGEWPNPLSRAAELEAAANGQRTGDFESAQSFAGRGPRDHGGETLEQDSGGLRAAVERHEMARQSFRRYALNDCLEGTKAALMSSRLALMAMTVAGVSGLIVALAWEWWPI